jgi:acyl-CoA synthetase (NDP forming)
MVNMEQNQQPALEYLFNPGSIAIAGASNHAGGFSAGRIYMQVLADCGFKGKMYPVNPNGETVCGWKGYRNIKDIPGPVDYAISAIPARHAPQFISDCADKGVRAVHLFTAGFREIEDQEGGRLETAIARAAARSGMRLIGPNCMGLYCPASGLSFALNFPEKSGPFGFLAQSGGNSTFCVWEATERGVNFSKAISYGNAVDLSETDFLEYLTADSRTEIIGAYIEGIKDGPHFLSVLRPGKNRSLFTRPGLRKPDRGPRLPIPAPLRVRRGSGRASSSRQGPLPFKASRKS